MRSILRTLKFVYYSWVGFCAFMVFGTLFFDLKEFLDKGQDLFPVYTIYVLTLVLFGLSKGLSYLKTKVKPQSQYAPSETEL